MKTINTSVFVSAMIVLSACGTQNTSIPAASTATRIPPTAAISPTSSPTPTPARPVITSSNAARLQEDFRIGQGAVSDAVWMPDGNVALAYSTGISIYDPVTGKLIRSVEPENKAVGSSIMSPDGKHVAALMYKDNKVLVWDANTGQIEYELETGCQVHSLGYQMVAFNGDGSQLAACDEEGVSLWDLSSGNKIQSFKLVLKDDLSIVFNPNNNTLATSSYSIDRVSADIVIWDLASGQASNTFHQNSGENLRFSHQGTILAWKNYSSKGVQIVLYDINTKQRKIVYVPYFEVFEFSPDDKTLTLGGGYGWGTRLLDIGTGQLITESNNNVAYLIKYSPDGGRFVAGWNDFSVFENVGDSASIRLGTFNAYSQIAFDPKGRYIAVGGFDDFVALWDLQSKKPELDHILANGTSFAFTPNGDGFIANAWNNGNWWQSIQEWDLRTGNQNNFEGTLADSYAGNKPPLFSPSGDLLAIGSPYAFNQFFGLYSETYIRFWDPNSKKVLFDITHSYLSDYEFSPDGKIFASAGQKTIYFWDARTQKALKQLQSPADIYDIAFSPDGALIAAAARNGVYVWDTNSGKLISEFNELREFFQMPTVSATRQVVFGPQGNILASIGYDKDLHKILFVWDLSNMKLLYKIEADKDQEAFDNLTGRAGLLFSPDGSFIVTSGLKHEGTYWHSLFAEPKLTGPYSEYVQFWDTSSGQLIKTLEYAVGFNSHSPYQNRYGFSPDGRLFAIADGPVHILYASP